MVAGINLAVLSLNQHLYGFGFIGVLGFVVFNAVFVQLRFSGEVEEFEVPCRDSEMPGDERPEITIQIDSVYESVSSRFPQVVMVFITQTCLLLSWWYSSYVRYETNKVCYGFWFLAYLVQMSGIFCRGQDSAIGRSWKIQRWKGIRDINQQIEYKCQGDWHSMSDFHMLCREIMGAAVNTLYRDLIAFLTPLVLMQCKDSSDFVQNCFAVAFITQLDDMTDGKLVYRARTPEQTWFAKLNS